MKHGTNIEWTHMPGFKGESWNPTRGCTLVSEGCKNCYAMHQAHRYSKRGQPYFDLTEVASTGPRWNGNIRLVEDAVDKPLHWQKPRCIFVNSMSDLFHEKITDEFIDQVLARAALRQQHIFIVLTKRPERMAQYFYNHPSQSLSYTREAKVLRAVEKKMRQMGTWDAERYHYGSVKWKWPLPNLWLGVSIEDQDTADLRVPPLILTEAAVRIISYEPALGPVDLSVPMDGLRVNALKGARPAFPPIDWVIAGGESGPGARPSHPDWFSDVRDQCTLAGVPFYFKQWGKWAPHPYPPLEGKNTGAGIFLKKDGTHGNQGDFWNDKAAAMDRHKNKRDAGDVLDFNQYHDFPEVKS